MWPSSTRAAAPFSMSHTIIFLSWPPARSALSAASRGINGRTRHYRATGVQLRARQGEQGGDPVLMAVERLVLLEGVAIGGHPDPHGGVARAGANDSALEDAHGTHLRGDECSHLTVYNTTAR